MVEFVLLHPIVNLLVLWYDSVGLEKAKNIILSLFGKENSQI